MKFGFPRRPLLGNSVATTKILRNQIAPFYSLPCMSIRFALQAAARPSIGSVDHPYLRVRSACNGACQEGSVVVSPSEHVLVMQEDELPQNEILGNSFTRGGEPAA